MSIEALRVDGGAARNDLLMQFQADVLGKPVQRPIVNETTALGAAYLAGLAAGVWASPDQVAAGVAAGAGVLAEHVVRPARLPAQLLASRRRTQPLHGPRPNERRRVSIQIIRTPHPPETLPGADRGTCFWGKGIPGTMPPFSAGSVCCRGRTGS